MRIPFKSLVFLCLSSLTTVALADPPRPSHNYWRNTNYPTHYVLYDYVSRSYIETVDCKALHRFRVLTNALNTLTLYDDSRGMTMQVNYEGMWLKASGASTFTFYQSGTFDTREQFSHNDARGMPTGTIYRTSGCRWQEKLTGSAAPNYNFVQTLVNAGAVEMLDQSRGISVRLEAGRMLLRQGGQPYGFFKNGHW